LYISTMLDGDTILYPQPHTLVSTYLPDQAHVCLDSSGFLSVSTISYGTADFVLPP